MKKHHKEHMKGGVKKRSRAHGGHPAKFQPSSRETKPEKFSEMETGQIDRDEGRGPMGQEGEGERQNDQLAELERMMPESDPPYRRARRVS